MHTSQTVLSSIIALNRLEEELKALGAYSKKRSELEKTINRLRPKIPHTVLSHHDRIRTKGRRSIAPVQDWICHGCYITIPIGLRQPLSLANDLFVCENCGSYIYLPDGTENRPLDISPAVSKRSKKIAAVVAQQVKDTKDAKDIKEATAAKPKASATPANGDRVAMMRELMAKMRKSDEQEVESSKDLRAVATARK